MLVTDISRQDQNFQIFPHILFFSSKGSNLALTYILLDILHIIKGFDVRRPVFGNLRTTKVISAGVIRVLESAI